MTTKKSKLLAFTSLWVIMLMIAFVFIFPSSAYAESIYAVLKKTDSGFGQQVNNIWKGFLAVVNSLVMMLLIVVAFAEMLRINVSTYGIKKVLPTLVFAIIAANFSFLFCRVVIDLANVSVTFLSCLSNPINDIDLTCQGGAASRILEGKAAPSGGFLEFPKFVWDGSMGSDFWRNLLTILVLVVEGILLLCLAFLFVVRNWMIYVLVVVSPVAFMAMVLPQTKKYFSQWWSNFIKWTFMPLVSYFFIVLANVLVEKSGLSPLMSAVWIGACLFAAITAPFKLGGSVMQNFYKGTGAKFLAGKTKDFGETKAKATGMRAWNKYKRLGLDIQREDNAFGRTKLGQAIGRNWIGTGLDKAKADLAHEEATAKGLVEGVQARHYYGKGKGLQMEREYNNNRTGEIKEYEQYAVLDIIKGGIKDENDPAFKQLVKWRLGSGHAMRQMAVAESAIAAMKSDGVTSSIDGRLVSKSDTGARKSDELAEQIESVKKDQNLTPDERDATVESLTAAKKTIDDERTEKWKKMTGMNDDDLKELRGVMEYAVTQQASSEALQSKAENDLRDKSAMQIVGIHEVAELADEVQKTEKAFKGLSANAQALFDHMLKTGKKFADLDASQKSIYEANGAFLNQKARAETLLQQHGLIQANDQFYGNDGKVVKAAADRKTSYVEALRKKFGTAAPAYLKDLLDIGADGLIKDIHKMERTTYTRFAGVVAKKTEGRVEGYAGLQTDALMSILRNGDKKDGITAEMATAFLNGELVLDDKGKPDPNKNSRLSAAWKAAQKQLSSSATASEAAGGILGIFDETKTQKVMQEWVEKEKGKQHNTQTAPNVLFEAMRTAAVPGSKVSAADMQRMMLDYYNARPANTRGDLNGAMTRFLPQAIYT